MVTKYFSAYIILLMIYFKRYFFIFVEDLESEKFLFVTIDLIWAYFYLIVDFSLYYLLLEHSYWIYPLS
jgi:hypothetical protein